MLWTKECTLRSLRSLFELALVFFRSVNTHTHLCSEAVRGRYDCNSNNGLRKSAQTERAYRVCNRRPKLTSLASVLLLLSLLSWIFLLLSYVVLLFCYPILFSYFFAYLQSVSFIQRNRTSLFFFLFFPLSFVRTKAMFATRKSVPRFSRRSDHTKTWPL